MTSPYVSLLLYRHTIRRSSARNWTAYLSPVMLRDPKAKTNLQHAKAARHESVAPVCGGNQSDAAERHQAQTHDRDDANRKRATGDDRGSIEQQPDRRQQRDRAEVEQRKREASADDDWWSKAQQEFAARAGE